jgi:hypothetical protein
MRPIVSAERDIAVVRGAGFVASCDKTFPVGWPFIFELANLPEKEHITVSHRCGSGGKADGSESPSDQAA